MVEYGDTEPTGVSPEREAEVEGLLEHIAGWASDHPDVIGLLLVGSWARRAPRPESDVDLVIVTTDPGRYSDSSWIDEVELGEPVRRRAWGAVSEWRFRTGSGLDVEINIGAPAWASTQPVDPGTRRVVRDGARPLHDPTGILASLIRACDGGES
ncbi:nucleotidyltransferase domain-containing protein [Streptomyces oryzae]|uniref:Nucleotidyltransferase domain-containing protein n=1 Tax=Streptomyces oryzae TaxID=1434886 RepID=A0ABS3X409_9ACTN|nr:nucleotidyltransferase domain-containing protein [Streptomyces oryzae]MBO8190122.1 nucleotidyltransferase domain-containing protein [Streptomyces oryzae]